MTEAMTATYCEPKMVSVPAGDVDLGYPCAAGLGLGHAWEPQGGVLVANFKMAACPVSVKEYACFLQATSYAVPENWDAMCNTGSTFPARGISADDADAYCAWLSRESGKAYRLPNVSEWEKAARGTLSRKKFPWGDDTPEGRCCFAKSEADGPMPVGSFEPNGYGLYDMAGNIWEWTSDLYVDIASDAPVNTPTGKPAEINRVLVGGSFMTGAAESLYVAYRHEDPPDLRHAAVGFRLAL